MIKATYIGNKVGVENKQITAVISLLDEGATIPFIARYRKERTGNLDEVSIQEIRDASEAYDEILKRKAYIISVLDEKGIESQSLRTKINESFDLNQLEDLYLPYKTRRKTKAEKARKAGLEGLAKIIMKQDNGDIHYSASRFLSGDYPDEEKAIEGASYIIAEWINENDIVREKLRGSFFDHGILTAKVVKTKKEEAQKYHDYFDFGQRLKNCPAYRVLAVLRGVDEGFLKMKIEPNKDYVMEWLNRFYVKNSNEASEIVKKAISDAYKRLLQPGLETETKQHYKEKADEQSIKTFSKNLEKLLLAPPLGTKRILAIDPGFASGCKVVCLDENGELLHNCAIFPHPPKKDLGKASAKISQLVESYKVEVIAIGDGTAGRETEAFIKRIRFNKDIAVYVVREDGASIYSASKIAREEFPQYDVTVRGAVSIGRRLMDPLAELVKIDPKSLGVGQYQHDVNQVKLQRQLDDVVLSAVNRVGVDLNTASKYLLSYVSGVGPKLAENIVAYRNENGRFESREELKKVARLGTNAYQQSAGFLRVSDGKNLLDNSAVHPEHYDFVMKGIKAAGLSTENVVGNKEAVDKLKKSISDELINSVGKYTIEDIFQELEKPGRDPRKKAKILEFSSEIKTIDDVRVGMRLPGIVTNVTDFGAFVNIGIKENGLIHKTQLSNNYVAHPTDVISLHDHVTATVVNVDIARKRIGLSLKEN